MQITRDKHGRVRWTPKLISELKKEHQRGTRSWDQLAEDLGITYAKLMAAMNYYRNQAKKADKPRRKPGRPKGAAKSFKVTPHRALDGVEFVASENGQLAVRLQGTPQRVTEAIRAFCG